MNEILQTRALNKERCEKLKALCSLMGKDIIDVINEKENEEVLHKEKSQLFVVNDNIERIDYIRYKNKEMCLKYPQYSQFVTKLSFKYLDFETLDVSLYDTSNVVILTEAFSHCNNLREITGLEYWDTSRVDNANGMFSGCSKLKKIDISNFNFTKCHYIINFFAGCTNLEEINGLEKLGHTKAVSLTGIFMKCEKLNELDLSNWDLKNVKDISYMFNDCNMIKSINFTGWNTSRIFYTSELFDGCRRLEILKGCTDEKLMNCFKRKKLTSKLRIPI